MKKFSFYKTIIKDKFVKLGVNPLVAEDVSDSLVLATARGIRSHGINLVNHYGRSVLTGRKILIQILKLILNTHQVNHWMRIIHLELQLDIML